MSALGLPIGEMQRVTTQLEEALSEAGHYGVHERADAAAALSDLAVRLELARLTVLDPGADEGGS